MVAAVAIGSAVVGGVASNMAAGEQADGARDAAGMSADATRESVAEQRRQYNLSRTDLAPYRETGTNALAEYAALFGLGRNGLLPLTASEAQAAPVATEQWGDTPQSEMLAIMGTAQQMGDGEIFEAGGNTYRVSRAGGGFGVDKFMGGELGSGEASDAPMTSRSMEEARARFTETPGYQFRFDEGTRALDRSAAARGGLRGGGFARELTRYGQGIASAEFGNYADRLAGIAGMGQGATTATATLGQQSANSIGNALMTGANMQGNALQNAATARASGYAGVGNAVTGAAQNYMFMNAMQNNSLPSINYQTAPGYL